MQMVIKRCWLTGLTEPDAAARSQVSRPRARAPLRKRATGSPRRPGLGNPRVPASHAAKRAWEAGPWLRGRGRAPRFPARGGRVPPPLICGHTVTRRRARGAARGDALCQGRGTDDWEDLRKEAGD